MSNVTLIRTTSHRSRERMRRIVGDVQGHFSWNRPGAFYFIPDEHLSAVLAIPGITRARRPDDLQRTIQW